MTSSHVRNDKPLILAVDDVPDNLALIASLLKDTCRVKVATRGDKALRIAAGDPAPELILLDVVMPDMDGHEVCRQLKNDPATSRIPVVFLTAMSDAAQEAVGLSLGAAAYIAKPIDPEILLACVRACLGKQDGMTHSQSRQ